MPFHHFTINKVFYVVARDYATETHFRILNKKSYRLVYILSGNAVYRYKDFEKKISSNTLLFLAPDDDHEVEVIGKQNYSFITIAFSITRALPANTGLIQIFQLPQARLLFEQIHSIYELRAKGWYPLLMSKTYSILYHMSIAQAKQEKNEYIEDILNYLKANYQRTLTLEELAEHSGFSLTHFKRMFKAATGTTPIAYLNNFRIERAKDFLRSEMFSIREVATLCGFQNEYYFSTAFKKAVGIPPKQYQSENM